MEEAVIKTEIRDNAAWLTINRPHAMNALSRETVIEIDRIVSELADRDDVRALVFRGAGKAFCAGGDLKYFKETVGSGDMNKFRNYLNLCQDMYRRVETFPRPTIAMVNGVAVAGGLELILSCDMVVAARSAKIGDGHANFGIIPGGGGAIRLPRKMPMALAKRLLFTGNLFSADELARWGLVNEVVPDEQLEDTVRALVGQVAKNSPLGLRVIKQLVNDGFEQPLDTALRLEVVAWESYGRSEDIREGLQAFDEKRKPVFKGR
ncbi:MAG: enoyl-CoA hydratase/isomerase family protein [Burkholderiales bacterium]|nr:enoyl-CoA hydratase/isomerase family protein [Burkholderiales bacterium]ODU66261.1 MAG: enoyl-CoA hydratase [Lautropia sp. SCN 66-9]